MGTAPSVMGKWMAETWHWDAFVTLTFRDPPPTPENKARGYSRVGARGGEKALLKWLHESVVPRAPGAFWWFVEEAHRDRSTPHFHGLGGVAGARRDELWHDWFEDCDSRRPTVRTQRGSRFGHSPASWQNAGSITKKASRFCAR